jgi:hypothetical protein
MKADPSDPPFWELARGYGPVTDQIERKKRAARLRRVDDEIAQMENWRCISIFALRELRDLYDERRELTRDRKRYAPAGLYDYDIEEVASKWPDNPGRENDWNGGDVDWGSPQSTVRICGGLGDGNRHVGHRGKDFGTRQ